MSSPWNPLDRETGSTDYHLPQGGEVVELSEDVYAQIVKQVREICDAMNPDGLPANEPVLNELEKQTREEVISQLSQTWPDTTQQFETLLKKTTHPLITELPDAIHSEDLLKANREELKSLSAPVVPESLEEVGVSQKLLVGLLLKFLFLDGVSGVDELSRRVKLPSHLIAKLLQEIVEEAWVEVVTSQEEDSRFLYQLTDLGQVAAQECIARCRYIGPAPVSLDQYLAQVEIQSLHHESFPFALVSDGLSSLVQSEEVRKRLGLALNHAHSLLLSGDSGNGKTATAQCLGELVRDQTRPIYIPYSIAINEQILAVFDAHVHQPVGSPDSIAPGTDPADERWRLVKRPFVSLARSVKEELLSPKTRENSGFSYAPLALKLNGGLLLVDDYEPATRDERCALESWLIAADAGMTLQFPNGKSIKLPLDVMTVVTTRQQIERCFDQAVLRRFSIKVELKSPSSTEFREIFRRSCLARGVSFDEWIVSRLIDQSLTAKNLLKASDSRDLLDLVDAICRLKGLKLQLNENILREAYEELRSEYRLAG